MKLTNRSRFVRTALAAALLAGQPVAAHADAVADWNARTHDLVVEAKLGTPPAVRVMAIAQTAALEAVDAVLERHPEWRASPRAAQGAPLDAAIAAAHRTALRALLPSQQGSIEAAYGAAIATIADTPARSVGIEAGERAAAAVLARRADDVTPASLAYRPHAGPGHYVPTATPAALPWPQRRPWLMTHAAQFRPGPPPALDSAAWARDYDEVKALGAKSSSRRTAEQTEIARFWEYSLPSIYFGVVHSVARSPGRDVAQNARLYAAVAQSMDDALIGVFDAKYHYNFWRPVTAIRNGDIDGNDATERDAAWTSFVEAPLHPEYPSAHSILAGAVGAVLKAEIGAGPTPELTTSSPSAKGVARRWTRVDDFVAEVGNGRIYEGIHYRSSTDVGAAMGRRIGELAVAAVLRPEP